MSEAFLKNMNRKNSKPRLKWLSFPIIGIFIFIVYWLVATPLIFVAMSKHYSIYKPGYGLAIWPIYYWIIALIIFTIILIICVIIWKFQENKKKNYSYLPGQDRISCNHDKNECYIQMSDLKKRDSYDSLVLKDEEKIELRATEPRDNKRRHTEFPKPKPKLEIKLRPLSQPQESVLTPMTPREVFFMDLIEAAENSPDSQIPTTKLFLENERQHNKAVIVDEKVKTQQNGRQSPQNSDQVPKNVTKVPQNVTQLPQNVTQIPQDGAQTFDAQDMQEILNAHQNKTQKTQTVDKNIPLNKVEHVKEVLKNDDDSTGVIEHITDVSNDSKTQESIFIASVPPKGGESNVVFMYIPDCPPELDQQEFEQTVTSE